MTIIAGIIYLLFLGYFMLLFFFLRNWNELSTTTVGNVENGSDLSVVIPVRNEAEGIIKCIDAILEQKYSGEFNIIVVDDHSTDGTAEIVRQKYDAVQSVKLIALSDQDGDNSGKKAALSLGISESAGNIIVTTDGDCEYSPRWLATLTSCFNNDVQIVTGPVIYPDGAKMLEGFQALDLLSLILATVAGIQSRNYFLGNGANLAFKRTAFDAVNRYAGNEGHVSGDDLFLIQKIADHYGANAIGYAKSIDAAVLTEPPTTLRGFMSQRLRWASKNDALNGRRVYYLWIFLWCVNASVIALLILGTLGAVPLWIVGLLIYVKMLIEGISLYKVSDYFNMKGAMRWFPWAFFLNILYVVGIGLMAGLKPSFKWKGR